MDLEELKRQRKRSRQSRELMNDVRYSPSAPPMAEVMVPNTPSNPVKRTFSNAGSVPSRFTIFLNFFFSSLMYTFYVFLLFST